MQQRKILIGGAALVALGSSRATKDKDYMVFEGREPFTHEPDGDYVHASGHPFFHKVWRTIPNTATIAPPEALMELKVFAFVQHCINRQWQKADDAEYDIKFLFRTFGVKPELVWEYLLPGQRFEVQRLFAGIRL